MAIATRAGGWFVPHDISAPIAGARDGPLAGLTVAVKDAFDVAGARTGAGSPAWLAEQSPAGAHAAAVAALLAAGATVAGKTVCDELFYSLSGENAHYGTPVNPRAPGCVPGGSSSGSAAAVAAGACDLGLGTDTGGSIRVPAAFCGIYGLRPTHGRVATGGLVPMAPSFDTVGWFAAAPGLLARAGAVLLDRAGAVAAAPERLIVASDAFAQADPGVATLCRAFLAGAAASLPPPRPQPLAAGPLDRLRETFRVVQAAEVWESFGGFVTRTRPALGPGIAERVAAAAQVSDAEAAPARSAAAEARALLRAALAPGTIVALPTAPAPAPAIAGGLVATDGFRARCLRLTALAGLGGLPQLSIPVGTIDGRPVGISLIGWAGADECLLDLAGSLARAVGLWA